MAQQTKTMIQNHPNHTPTLTPNQCSSTITQKIKAPLSLVWSLVSQFDNPRSYKQFIKSCKIISGTKIIEEGCVREIMVMSGLPAERSIERLDILDDDLHVMKFSIIGGDHQLKNYKSTTNMHEENDEKGGGKWTVVIESYVVDIPVGSCKEDTCSFADTIVSCNLRSLARVSEKMATG